MGKSGTGLMMGLFLLGALGGCNLQTGSPPPSCPHPLFGAETPLEICREPTYWSDRIFSQGGPPGDNPFNALLIGGHIRMGAGSSGPALGYLRVPGFPEHRFLVQRRLPRVVGEQCERGPIRGCFARDYISPIWTFGVGESIGGNPVGREFPFAAGRGGSTEVEMDWLTQIKATRMYHVVDDPAHYVRLMEEDPHPMMGKTYAFTLVHRYEIRSGEVPRVTEDPTLRGPRRAPEHDAYPMTRGYLTWGRQMANIWRTRVGQEAGFTSSDPLNPILERAQHHWDHESYYVFRVGSGFISPPTPFCQPGMGWFLPFYVGSFVPRKIPIDPAQVPPEKFQGNLFEQLSSVEPFVRYLLHQVHLVGQDVVDYHVRTSGTLGGWGWEPPVRSWLQVAGAFPSPPQYPVSGRGTPPERTLRVGVLYRVTNLLDWRPDPSHPYGEDEWHLVWSEVRLGARCETLRIGFHTFDRTTSARLDEHFGLAPVGEIEPFMLLFPFRPVPILSRLSRDGTFTATPGAVKLPEWAMPPGW